MGFCERVPTITGSGSSTQWGTLHSVIPKHVNPRRLRVEATVTPCHALPHGACTRTADRSGSSAPWAHLGWAKGCGWAPHGSSAPIFSIQTIHKPSKSSSSLCEVHTHLVRVTAFPTRPVLFRAASEAWGLHCPVPGRQLRAPPPATEAPLYTAIRWLAAQGRKTLEFVLNQFNTFQWPI